MNLAWTDRLSVRNELIDSEHKVLLGMINEVERAIRARNSVALPKALQQLEVCVSVHFSNEEAIAKAINFPFKHNKIAFRQWHVVRKRGRALLVFSG